jgi:hypothetical protein
MLHELPVLHRTSSGTGLLAGRYGRRARLLQYQYTGIPVSKIPSPITEFSALLHTVLATIATQLNANNPVV